MVQTGTPSGNEKRAETARENNIFQACGEPSYPCRCIDRWENEGGAVRVTEDLAHP